MACAPSTSDQPGHPPGLIRVFAVRMKKAWVLSYPLNAEQRLIRLGVCPGWSESSLGAQIILLVLSWGGSNIEDKTSSLHQAELRYNSKHPDVEMIFGHFLCVLSCRHNSVDINVAVATDAGLITPIVFRADNKVRLSWPMLKVSLTQREQWRLRRASVQSPLTLSVHTQQLSPEESLDTDTPLTCWVVGQECLKDHSKNEFRFVSFL